MQNDLRENYKLLEIKIDGNQDYVQDIIWTVAPLKSNGLLYIGGKPETNDALVEGFDGCMSSIFIDSKPLRRVFKKNAQTISGRFSVHFSQFILLIIFF